MAFFNRAGSILRQTVSKHITHEMSVATPTIFQMIRCMSGGPTSSKIFVGGLAWGVDETSLRETFGAYGEVYEARVIMDRDTGRSRGFGFVTFANSETASAAIQAMDQKELQGRTVSVNYANERSQGYGGGGGNYGGGYGGGSGNYGGGYGGGGGNYGGGRYGGGDSGYGGNSYGSGGDVAGGGGYGGNNYGSGGDVAGSGVYGGNNYGSGGDVAGSGGYAGNSHGSGGDVAGSGGYGGNNYGSGGDAAGNGGYGGNNYGSGGDVAGSPGYGGNSFGSSGYVSASGGYGGNNYSSAGGDFGGENKNSGVGWHDKSASDNADADGPVEGRYMDNDEPGEYAKRA